MTQACRALGGVGEEGPRSAWPTLWTQPSGPARELLCEGEEGQLGVASFGQEDPGVGTFFRGSGLSVDLKTSLSARALGSPRRLWLCFSW